MQQMHKSNIRGHPERKKPNNRGRPHNKQIRGQPLKIGRAVSVLILLVFLVTGLSPPVWAFINETSPEGLRTGDKVTVVGDNEHDNGAKIYATIDIPTPIKVNGTAQGYMFIFKDDARQGNYHLASLDSLEQWVQACNGSWDSTYGVPSMKNKYIHTVCKNGQYYQRFHIRDIAEMCGADWLKDVFYDSSGIINVRTTAWPTPTLKVSGTANAGGTINWSVTGKSNVRGRYANYIAYALKVTINGQDTIISSKEANSQTITDSGTYTVPSSVTPGSVITFQLNVRDGVGRRSTAKQDITIGTNKVVSPPPEPPQEVVSPPEPPTPPEPPDYSPRADFAVSPNPGYVDGEITFTDKSKMSVPPGTTTSETIVSWKWEFSGQDGPDGKPVQEGQTVKAVWHSMGNYTVKLTVTDSDGDTDTCTKTIVIGPANPVAVINTSANDIILGREITIDGDQSTAAAGREIRWDSMEWEFYRPGEIVPCYTSSNRYPLSGETETNNLLNCTGIWKVRLRVTDDHGDKSEWTEKLIHVYPDNPPTAQFQVQSEAVRNSYNNYEVNVYDQSISDPTDAALGDSIVKREWRLVYDANNNQAFNDPQDEVILPSDPPGTKSAAIITTSENDTNPKIRFYKTGRYQLQLTVTEGWTGWGRDNLGLTAQSQAQTMVVNLPPTVEFEVKKRIPVDVQFVADYTVSGSKYSSLVSAASTTFTSALTGAMFIPAVGTQKVNEGEMAQIWSIPDPGITAEPSTTNVGDSFNNWIGGTIYPGTLNAYVSEKQVNLDSGEIRIIPYEIERKLSDGTYIAKKIKCSYSDKFMIYEYEGIYRLDQNFQVIKDYTTIINSLVPPNSGTIQWSLGAIGVNNYAYGYQKTIWSDSSGRIYFYLNYVDTNNPTSTVKTYVKRLNIDGVLDTTYNVMMPHYVVFYGTYYEDETLGPISSILYDGTVWYGLTYSQSFYVNRHIVGTIGPLGYKQIRDWTTDDRYNAHIYNGTPQEKQNLYAPIGDKIIINTPTTIEVYSTTGTLLGSAGGLSNTFGTSFVTLGSCGGYYVVARYLSGYYNGDVVAPGQLCKFYTVNATTGQVALKANNVKLFPDNAHARQWVYLDVTPVNNSVAVFTSKLVYYSDPYNLEGTYRSYFYQNAINVSTGQILFGTGIGPAEFGGDKSWQWVNLNPRGLNSSYFIINHYTTYYTNSRYSGGCEYAYFWWIYTPRVYTNNGINIMTLSAGMDKDPDSTAAITPTAGGTGVYAPNDAFIIYDNNQTRYYNSGAQLIWALPSSYTIASLTPFYNNLLFRNGNTTAIVSPINGQVLNTISHPYFYNESQVLVCKDGSTLYAYGQKQGLTYLLEILNSHTWDPEKKNFIVSVIDNTTYKDYSSLRQTLIDALNAKKVSLSTISPAGTIQTQVQNIIRGSNTGWWIATNNDMNIPLADLASKIIALLNEDRGADNIVLVSEAVDMLTTYSDSEHDSQLKTRFVFSHDPTKLGTLSMSNPQGLSMYHGQTLYSITNPFSFDKPGTYQIQCSVQDNPNTTADYLNHEKAGARWSEPATMTILVHRRPVAQFSMSTTTATTKGQEIIFTDQSYDPDLQFTDPEGLKGIRARIWQYRNVTLDEDWTTSAEPPSVFNNCGQYTVRLKVQDAHGAWSNWSEIKTFNVVNSPPIAAFEADPNPVATGQPCILRDCSSDMDGDAIVGWTWTVQGQGTYTVPGPLSVVWTVPGNYTVTLKVQDASGQFSNTFTQVIKVIANNRPVAVLNMPSVGYESEQFTCTGTGSYDPDAGDRIVNAYWQYKRPGEDWSDVYTQSEGDSDFLTFNITPDVLGVWTVRLVVRDNNGLESNPVEKAITIQEGFELSGSVIPDPAERGGGIKITAWAYRKSTGAKVAIDSITAYIVHTQKQDGSPALPDGQSQTTAAMAYDAGTTTYSYNMAIPMNIVQDGRWPDDGAYYIRIVGKKGTTTKETLIPFAVQGNILQHVYIHTSKW